MSNDKCKGKDDLNQEDIDKSYDEFASTLDDMNEGNFNSSNEESFKTSNEESFKQEKSDNVKMLFESQYKILDVDLTIRNPKLQHWLWPGIIPRDTFTLFAGLGGVGKSQLLAEIAARVSTGHKFEAGGNTHQIQQGRVLIMNAEDSIDCTLLPRLIAAQANLKNIRVITKVLIGHNDKTMNLDLTTQISLLEDKIKEYGDVKLIIIDPITYFIGNIRDHVATEVANFLSSLNDLAEKYKLAIIINKHLRKQASGSNVTSAVNEVGGSGAWVNTARQSFIVARDQDDPDKVLLCNLKVNISKQSREALTYEIVPHVVYDDENNSITTTKVKWHDKMTSITADEAVNKDAYEFNQTKRSEEFVLKYLKDKGMSVQKHLIDAAVDAGHAIRTVRRTLNYLKENNIILDKPGLGKNRLLSLIDE